MIVLQGGAALGFIAIFFLFIFTFASLSRTLENRTAFAYAALIASYGYSLGVASFLFFSIPWYFLNAAIVLVGIALFFWPSNRRFTVDSVQIIWRFFARNTIACLSVALALTVHLIANLIKPVLDIDGQLYHGPILANLIHENSLWGWFMPTQYMAYTDLTMAGNVNLATIAGSAALDDAAQMPYFLVLIVLVTWILLKRFQSILLSTSLAILISTAPVIWLQPRVLYVDLAYGVAVLSGIFLFATIKQASSWDYLTMGIAIGAVVGTKPAGLATGGLLLLLFAVKQAISKVIRLNRESFQRVFLLLAMVAMGFVFYLRNLFEFGNPVFPVKTALGTIQFPGLVDIGTVAQDQGSKGFISPERLWIYTESILTGVVQGVTKPDYDPRVGGFGYIPVAIVAVALLTIILELARGLSSKNTFGYSSDLLKTQGLIFLASILTIVIQPSSGDSRYVIGPTVAILTMVLLFTLKIWLPPTVAIVLSAVTLALAFAQIRWTETHAFPGLRVILAGISDGGISAAPTPANPWREGSFIPDLPLNLQNKCLTIGLQTHGGVSTGGMTGNSKFSTLSYSLYGDSLCNKLIPFYLSESTIAPTTLVNRLDSADILFLDETTQSEVLEHLGDSSRCFLPVGKIPIDSNFSEGQIVYRNSCLH